MTDRNNETRRHRPVVTKNGKRKNTVVYILCYIAGIAIHQKRNETFHLLKCNQNQVNINYLTTSPPTYNPALISVFEVSYLASTRVCEITEKDTYNMHGPHNIKRHTCVLFLNRMIYYRLHAMCYTGYFFLNLN